MVRAEMLARLTDAPTPWDVLVIGGGAIIRPRISSVIFTNPSALEEENGNAALTLS